MGGNHSVENNTTIQQTSGGSSAGDVGSTQKGPTQSQPISVPVTVTPPQSLAAAIPLPLPPANTAKAVDAVGGDAFLKAPAKDQAAVAPFTKTMDMLGATANASADGTSTSTASSAPKTGTNGASTATPDQEVTLGALAAAYDEAHKNWQDSKDSASGWYSAYDDVHTIVNQKAASGDAASMAIHKHLGGLMDQVKKDQAAVGPAKFASGVKSSMNWVARKHPGKPLTDALDEISDSEDDDDQNGKATSGKDRTRSGKLAGLRNIAAKAKKGGAVGGASVGANGANGANAAPKSKTNEEVAAPPIKGAKSGKVAPTAQKKAAKSTASDDEASDDEEEGSEAEGSDEEEDDEAGSAKASGDDDEEDDDEEGSEAADSEGESDAE